MSPAWADIVANTLTLGSIYALIGVGFVVLFRATGVVSFAQGGFIVLGCLMFASLDRAGLPLPASFLLSALAMAGIGAVSYWALFARLVGSPAFIVAISTVGLAFILEMIGVIVWSASPIIMDTNLGYERVDLLFNVSLSRTGVATVLITMGVFAVLLATIYLTRLGLHMRAVADEPNLAVLTGVSVVGISALAWAVAAGTGAIAGATYVMSSQPDPTAVFSLGLVALPAILLGGLNSIGGAAVGGLGVALIQNLAVYNFGGEYATVSAYVVLLVVLMVRPQGLFGSVPVVRL